MSAAIEWTLSRRNRGLKTEHPENETTRPRPMRIALVAEKFWPFSGPTEVHLGELAVELDRHGHMIQILTSKLDKTWPDLLDFREIPIHRIVNGSGPWGSSCAWTVLAHKSSERIRSAKRSFFIERTIPKPKLITSLDGRSMPDGSSPINEPGPPI